jgi:hypothetical protein
MKSNSILIYSLLLITSACLGADSKLAVRRDNPANIRGAVYVSADAFNAPQMWKNFSVAETARDFGYAQKIHLNALRIWASYEYWQMEPQKYQASFDQMLDEAKNHGIRILISLFENDGVPPTPENMWTTDPNKAFAIQSPGGNIASPDHTNLWGAPTRFVEWFMNRYRNDDRLLAIEVMNEPSAGRRGTFEFAKTMLTTAKRMQGTVPLTMGCARIQQAEKFIPYGLDVIEFHDNYPTNREEIEQRIQEALALGKKYDLPVWLTEWQRVRPSGAGWDNEKLTAAEIRPDYASLAATVQKYPVGKFFWSLMIKRAYLPPQRANGTINGLFWPDGSVWSLADARAISEDPALKLREVKVVPKGFLSYLSE